jgi:hypothetical protein
VDCSCLAGPDRSGAGPQPAGALGNCQETFIKRLSKKLEAALVAAAFAEEGDAATARRVLAEASPGRTATCGQRRPVSLPHCRPALHRPAAREHREATVMAHETKKKPISAMVLTGVASVALYAALLLYQDEVNAVCGRAGAYAVLPILTAFVFSIVHGTFTGHFWTVIGIEAARNKGEAK